MIYHFLFWSVVLFCYTIECSVVKLKQGSFRGVKHGNHYRFLGMRYAQPVERFRPPVPINSQTDSDDLIQDASKWQNSCPQFPNRPLSGFSRDLLMPRADAPEDCLFLNVFSPHAPEADSISTKPVLVFIHGGAFHSGSSSALIYDPSDWLSQYPSFILVTFDYRLGPLGYMVLPRPSDSKDEDPKMGIAGNGNFGLLDQILAIKWVHENIGAFGGDASRITIMGHSAGAMSASWLAALESSVFSFPISAYILMSGVGGMWHHRTLEGKFERLQYDSFLENTKCTDVECLRGVTVEQMQRANERWQTGYTWGPTIDGHLINAPFHLLQHYNPKAKVLLSAVRDEGSMFVPDNFEELAGTFFKNKLHNILPFYGRSLNYEVINAILSDGLFICPMSQFYHARKSSNPDNVHFYLLRYPMILTSLASALNRGKDYGVFHGSDVLMLFGNQRLLSSTYSTLVTELRRGLVEFLTTGQLPQESAVWNNRLEGEKMQQDGLFMMSYENWSAEEEHFCGSLWNSTDPLIPKNYKSVLALPERSF